eukprot:COSAG05_NODE_2895_length_2530_cov_2.067873_1_plen_81_part_10
MTCSLDRDVSGGVWRDWDLPCKTVSRYLNMKTRRTPCLSLTRPKAFRLKSRLERAAACRCAADESKRRGGVPVSIQEVMTA